MKCRRKSSASFLTARKYRKAVIEGQAKSIGSFVQIIHADQSIVYTYGHIRYPTCPTELLDLASSEERFSFRSPYYLERLFSPFSCVTYLPDNICTFSYLKVNFSPSTNSFKCLIWVSNLCFQYTEKVAVWTFLPVLKYLIPSFLN